MPDRLLTEIRRVLDQVPIDFGGRCSLRKAYLMAWLIRRFDLHDSLDIGVYRGRSLFPQAVAHKHAGTGRVTGVDPWSAAEADEHDHTELRTQIKAFVDSTDFEALYQEVAERAHTLGLSSYVRLVRETSQRAAERFAAAGTRFGLIHIDGNHDTEPVLQDVRAYLPLLKPGGFLVMDDVSWPSVRPALEEAASRAQLLIERTSADKRDDYPVLRAPGGPSNLGLKLRLRLLARG